MSKTASIVVYVVIFVLALLLCVGACWPVEVEYGAYNKYHSAITLIQGDGMFADVEQTAYQVKPSDSTADADQVAKDTANIIRSRLSEMYGYYFSKVTVDGKEITVNVPVTANDENTSATAILSNVTATGKVEFLKYTSSSSLTYSASNVVLSNEHIKSTKISRYSDSSQVSYIVNVTLTDEGAKLAKASLTESSSTYGAYVAIDGSITYGAVYYNGSLQVYTSSNQDCKILMSYINTILPATLTEIPVQGESNIVKSNVGMIFAVVMAAIAIICWIVYLVRYGKIAWGVILPQFIAAVVFVIFSGFVYFSLLNIASAIGILMGFALMTVFTVLVLEKFKAYMADGKQFGAARYRGFKENNKWNYIVHAIVLVAGVILWLIPTGVTAPLGNALVYWAVLSFCVTMGLNRMFTAMVANW